MPKEIRSIQTKSYAFKTFCKVLESRITLNLWRKNHHIFKHDPIVLRGHKQAPRSWKTQPEGMTGKHGVNNMTNIDRLCFTAVILKATWHTVPIWQISECLESNITDTGRSHSIHICLPCKSACDCLFNKKVWQLRYLWNLTKNNLFNITSTTSGFEQDKFMLIFYWTNPYKFWSATLWYLSSVKLEFC